MTMQTASHTDFKTLYEEQKQVNIELKAEVEKLQLFVAKLAAMQFGSKNEKFTPQDKNQLA